MLKKYSYEQLGGADHGWLKTKHHFSFASYFNPERMGFGSLRVVNDDLVQAGTGFGMHHHNNMEIITYVRAGAITHQDNQGNKGRTAAGDVQVMSAGTGIFHSEHNYEQETASFYQIWLETNQQNVEPRWEQQEFPKDLVTTQLPILVSGNRADGGLFINNDARIYGGRLAENQEISQQLKGDSYILISAGEFLLDDKSAVQGDGLEVTGQTELKIKAQAAESELLIIDLGTQHAAQA